MWIRIWLQCRSGSSFLPQCWSGSRELNQCEPIPFPILDRLRFAVTKSWISKRKIYFMWGPVVDHKNTYVQVNIPLESKNQVYLLILVHFFFAPGSRSDFQVRIRSRGAKSMRIQYSKSSSGVTKSRKMTYRGLANSGLACPRKASC